MSGILPRMRLFPFVLVPVLTQVSLMAQEPAAKTAIRWETDLAAAQAAAREDGKPVLAYFTFET
jgi:hypothetical protein